MIQGVLGIVAGFFFLLISRWVAQFSVRRWGRAFPGVRVSERGYRLAFVIGGCAFIVLGLLSVLGVIRDK
jgi:hypothetical protein